MNQESRELYVRLLGYMRPHARVFALSVLGMILAAATEPLFPALIKPLLDGGFGTGAKPKLSPELFAGAILGVFLVRGILTFFSSYCLHWVSHRLVLDLRGVMFSRLVRFPTRYFDDQSSGILLSKVAYDVTGVTGAATTGITVVVKDTIAIVGLLGWLLYLNWKLTLIALLVGPAIAWFVRVLSRRLRRMSREAQNAMGGMVHVLEESISCHKVVKIFSGQEYETRRFMRASQLLRGYYMRLVIPEALTTPVTHMLAAVALSIIIYVAMHESLADRATVGEFASFLTAMLMLLAPMKRITEVNSPLQRGLAAAESVFGMIDTPVEEDGGTLTLGRARGEVVSAPAGRAAKASTTRSPSLTRPAPSPRSPASTSRSGPAKRWRWWAARAGARP